MKKIIIFLLVCMAVVGGVGGVVIISNNKKKANEDVTYTVTFDSDGGSKIPEQKVVKGAKVKRPSDPTKKDYAFIEWTYRGEKYDFNQEVKSNLELKARWEELDEESYIVKFDTDGGSTISNQVVKKGTKVKKPSNPTKEDCTFIEWSLNGNTYDFDSVVTENIELVAVWKENLYKVSFETNGGSKISTQSVKDGAKVKKPANPKKTGYTFVEWQVNGKKYDFDTEVTGNVVIVAVWQENEYTVSFNSKGGSDVSSQKVKYGYKAVAPSSPTKDDYTFVEWQLDGKKYNFDTEITEDITLVAVWKRYVGNPVLSAPYQCGSGPECYNAPNYYYESGIYKYDLALDMSSYNGASGWDVFEKGNNTPILSNLTIGGAGTVEVEAGKKKVIYAKAYVIEKDKKVYGDESNEVILDHTTSPTPTLVNPYAREKLPFVGKENGKFIYDLALNSTDYFYGIDTDPKYTVLGWDVFEKGSSTPLLTDLAMGGAGTIEVEAGTKKTYVARVYVYNSKGKKVYSSFSNELVFDHTTLRAPVFSNGYDSYVGFENGKYIYDLAVDWASYANVSLSDIYADGWDIFEKGSNTPCVTNASMDGAGVIEVEAGTKKTYVARVFVYNASGAKVYSQISNELVFDHTS